MKTRFLQNPNKFNIFYVARELGMTVKRMSHEMDYSELVEWLAFFAVKAQYEKQASEQ